MIIQAIKTSGTEKLLAIATRRKDGKCSESILCDWNTVPNTLRMFDRTSSKDVVFASFKDAVKYIFSL